MTFPTTSHRTYPLEPGPWVMGQRWHELLFAHWRVDPDSIRKLLPSTLELDLFDDAAWLGVVPFAMTDVRARGLPAFVGVSSFLELNVRTYARVGDRVGVYFFSLDASNRTAVATARRWFHLPYFNARMELRQRVDWIDYQSRRTHRNAVPAHLAISYRPYGVPTTAAPDTLEHWLVERYRLLADSPDGAILTGEIHHQPWKIQPVEVEIHRNTIADWLGISIDRDPDHVCFARFQDVYIWRPRKIASAVGMQGITEE